VFTGQINQCLALDSVNGCTITGNTDAGTPLYGSWYTVAAHASGGSYTFDNNDWTGSAPALFHIGSSYVGGADRGIRWRNQGNSTPGSAATSLAINHGVFRTPVYCNAILEGLGDNVWLSAVGATTLTANWTTSTTPKIFWEARVA
jgi:hypothetical protein